MWDANNLKPIKTIDVDGRPDGILNDDFNHRTYIFSHQQPNATVIDANTGNVLGTIDLGGQPEQAAEMILITDTRGKIIYVNPAFERITGRAFEPPDVAKRVGDLRTEEDFLKSRSPLFFVDRIKAPLLIGQGANDPRVKQAESDQIVAALRKANKPVEYIGTSL